jgi:hypothetical protein
MAAEVHNLRFFFRPDLKRRGKNGILDADANRAATVGLPRDFLLDRSWRRADADSLAQGRESRLLRENESGNEVVRLRPARAEI